MKLVVVSHKVCWSSSDSPSGYVTDGGFPFQMSALSELFDETILMLPLESRADSFGTMPLTGYNISVRPLTLPVGQGWLRKLGLLHWLFRNGLLIVREVWRADSVHAPIPGDIGTIGIVIALLIRKPLFVRYCGNWTTQVTVAQRLWIAFLEQIAGGRNVVLATGGGVNPPSTKNYHIEWVFSTSLSQEEMKTQGSPHKSLTISNPRLITVARQERGKQTDAILHSFPLILKRFPDIYLDIVGDGSALPKLKRQAEAMGVQDRIVFHGQVSHDRVMELLMQAHVFCFPTASEGFPKAVIEALACGLPVIATRVSVLPDLIQQGCGVLLNELSSDELARAVSYILDDPETYMAMSGRAVTVASQYSLEAWRDTIGHHLRMAWGPLSSVE